MDEANPKTDEPKSRSRKGLSLSVPMPVVQAVLAHKNFQEPAQPVESSLGKLQIDLKPIPVLGDHHHPLPPQCNVCGPTAAKVIASIVELDRNLIVKLEVRAQHQVGAGPFFLIRLSVQGVKAHLYDLKISRLIASD